MNHFNIVICTNIWSLHIVPLATEIAKIIGVSKFRMVIFEQMHEERVNMGWEHGGNLPEWLVGPPDNPAKYLELLDVILNAEVAVLGTVPQDVLKKRAKTGKLTFILSERLFKKRLSFNHIFNPLFIYWLIRYRYIVNRYNMHALAIGYFAPLDLKTIDVFKNRIWRFGYFVELNKHEPKQQSNRPLQLLWVGRMLNWKRVDILIEAVAKIMDKPWFGRCLIVGDGPEKLNLMTFAESKNLRKGKIEFHPSIKMEDVRLLMQANDAYILSSNREEGWGAVAAEAMSEGCVLIANNQAGASQSLVKNGETGFLFADGDVDELVEILSKIGNDKELTEKIRKKAWIEIWGNWSPRVGAERIINLSQDLLNSNYSNRYNSGPCSHYF